jgi:hypothetical protein
MQPTPLTRYSRRAVPARGAFRRPDPADMSAHELRAELTACGHTPAELARFLNWTSLAAAVAEIRTSGGALLK